MTTADRRSYLPAAPPDVPSIVISSASGLRTRTFLLGNEGGFVLYLPLAQNVPDSTLQSVKWFGANGFGRAFLEDNRVWLEHGGQCTKLDRTNQVAFTLHVDQAVRTFRIDGCAVRQRFFIPNRMEALVMALEADGEASFVVEPQFDMRYYQAFNERFDGYCAEVRGAVGQPALLVTNRVEHASATLGTMDFFSLIGSTDPIEIELLPEDRRLRHKRYLKDELREHVIQAAYAETQERSPDEAPIWDRYETCAYAPAHLRGRSPLTLVYAFGDDRGETASAFKAVRRDVPALYRRKHDITLRRLEQGGFETGNADLDRAYKHVRMRFNNCLVARNVCFHGDQDRDHFNAIFAGNRYFLDAWKRDENISLTALLLTGHFQTVRAILDDTWQYQDPRTGRLPQIIRLGEPLVYYSSDGTLWALERLHRYTRMSGDTSLLDAKYAMVEHFFEASLGFVKRGLLPSGGIVDKTYLWETWMDTPFTPREGYPVEIELLWLTALKQYLPLFRDRNPDLAGRLEATLEAGRTSFARFQLDGYLADSLGYDWKPRDLLTPNGYMAFGLDVSLPQELEQSMVALGREQLAGRCGIRSLAPRDWPKVLAGAFLNDARNFKDGTMASVGIYNYHRGIEWLWLNQFLAAGELRCGNVDEAYGRYLRPLVHAALHEGGVAGLSELYDVHGPLGADYQAWSMAGFVTALHEFAGIAVDAVDRRVSIRPSLPAAWPRLDCRSQVGDSGFEVRVRQDGRDTQTVEVETLDPLPDGYLLEVGACVSEPHDGTRIALDGTDVPRERIRFVPAGPKKGDLWVQTPFRKRLTVRFVTPSSGS